MMPLAPTQEPPMRLLLTGQIGLDKKQYLQEVLALAQNEGAGEDALRIAHSHSARRVNARRQAQPQLPRPRPRPPSLFHRRNALPPPLPPPHETRLPVIPHDPRGRPPRSAGRNQRLPRPDRAEI